MLSQVRFKSSPRSFGTRGDTLDISSSLWMTAWLRSWEIPNSVAVKYSVSHLSAMNLGNGFFCGDGHWPSRAGIWDRHWPFGLGSGIITGLLGLGSGIVYQSIPATLSSVSHFFTMLYDGAFSLSMTTMSSWISLGVKPLKPM